MEQRDLAAWVERYVHAWETNDPADITALFTPDAVYEPRPDEAAWRGHEGIVAGWLERDGQPGTWTFRSEILAVAGDLGFVRGWTRYLDDGTEYSNLWVVRLNDDGRCSSFIEWWMERKPAA